MPADPRDNQAELDRLRRQVESVAADQTSPALAAAGEKAAAAVTTVGDFLTDLSDRVRQQPLAAVMVAFAAGYACRAVIRR